MTVRELIKKLEKMPQGHTVLVDLHSEYTDQVQLALIEAYENGGYVSRRKAQSPWIYRNFI